MIDIKHFKDAFSRIINDSLDIPYFICYRLFDLNDDDVICHRDIFKLFEIVKDYPFLEKDLLKFFNVSP